MATTLPHMTRNNFLAAVIGQHAVIGQNDDESGWVACVFPDGKAAIGQYSHCSCYGTFDDLCGGSIGDWMENGTPSFTWSGTVAELVAMAERTADPAMPERAADPSDYDYDHLVECYRQVIAWSERSETPTMIS